VLSSPGVIGNSYAEASTSTVSHLARRLWYHTPLGYKNTMSHISREKLDLLNRTKKVVGQLESVERALGEDAPCAEVLQRLAAARGAINSLMRELLEDHIRNHMPRTPKSSEAADDVIEIVRTYLK
jgi:FrmR/RcnR family transcriptional regulator, repressor of rcnA expression